MIAVTVLYISLPRTMEGVVRQDGRTIYATMGDGHRMDPPPSLAWTMNQLPM